MRKKGERVHRWQWYSSEWQWHGVCAMVLLGDKEKVFRRERKGIDKEKERRKSSREITGGTPQK